MQALPPPLHLTCNLALERNVSTCLFMLRRAWIDDSKSHPAKNVDWLIDGITGHCEGARDHLPCLVEMQNKIINTNWQKKCEKCSHTFATMPGSIKDNKEM